MPLSGSRQGMRVGRIAAGQVMSLLGEDVTNRYHSSGLHPSQLRHRHVGLFRAVAFFFALSCTSAATFLDVHG